ncbi:DEAD/DEAH box helicase [Xanthomonas sp. AmX2]|uniref:DEAD/DEAH box helicase n=1 Tax=Xanthomonas sp. TaxID=29446 RepID=UPI0019805974|nr:DEAD/DEAH box helicase [Xanthomonas sp.]MBN6149065.1 DEAD/DEAH box helicase [Xanthomonas sp.]
MSQDTPAPLLFADLGLSPAVMKAVVDVGYESPSPIQAATIPALISGRDLLGQAQTGTGKTAAFALPILSRLDFSQRKPQALVLAPTRELAIQVAEAFQRYASAIPGFHVLPVYGGQPYVQQLSALKRGVHVVVGTPGRVIDHLERGTLDLSELKTLVLDEADEMLRMGFIDDVEAVLKKLPASRQVALFSATMPSAIRRIAQTYLNDPAEVTIASKTTTSANIRQRFWSVSGMQKLDALTRILEVEPFDAMIVFARTKAGTDELAQKLQARGLAAAAINGDIQQAQRERVIQQLKDGKLDILVATDVAARGLDVERISHVLNYDIPYDTESYVHRIGRTGRAGRSGEAILFVSPREKGMLRAIERATRQPIEEMQLPSVEAVNDQRVTRFMEKISETIAAGGIELYRDLVQRFETERNVPMVEVAAALARLLQGDAPLLLAPERPRPPQGERFERPGAPRERTDRGERPERAKFEPKFDREARPPRRDEGERAPRPPRPAPAQGADFDYQRDVGSFEAPRRDKAPKAPRGEPEVGMETYRIEVGHQHGVKPANIVGAIANEAGLESKYIGRIDIHDDHSVLDLPADMPRELLTHLKKVWVSGQQLQMRKLDGSDGEGQPFKPKFARAAGKPGGRPNAAGPRPSGAATRFADKAGGERPPRKGPPKR